MTSLRRGALAIKYVLRSLSKTLSTHEHVRKEVVFNRTTIRNKLHCFILLIFNRKFFQKKFFSCFIKSKLYHYKLISKSITTNWHIDKHCTKQFSSDRHQKSNTETNRRMLIDKRERNRWSTITQKRKQTNLSLIRLFFSWFSVYQSLNLVW